MNVLNYMRNYEKAQVRNLTIKFTLELLQTNHIRIIFRKHSILPKQYLVYFIKMEVLCHTSSFLSSFSKLCAMKDIKRIKVALTIESFHRIERKCK